MIIIRKTLLLLVLSYVFIYTSTACDCNEPDFVWSYFNADLIVQAELETFITDNEGETLSIWKIWNSFKGGADSSYIYIDGPLNSFETYNSGSSCDWTSFEGAVYILYLDKASNKNVYYAGYCLRRKGVSNKSYGTELEWLQTIEPQKLEVYFRVDELNGKPSLKDLKSEIKSELLGMDSLEGFIDFVIKINKLGELESLGIKSKTKGANAEKQYDRYSFSYNLREPKTEIEKRLSKLLSRYEGYHKGQINDEYVKYSIRLVIYYDQEEEDIDFLGD